MRILFLSNVMPNSSGGGLPQRMANHLRALGKLGQVTLIVPRSDSAHFPELPGVKVLLRGPTLADQRLARQQATSSRLVRAWHSLRRLNMIDALATDEDKVRFGRELAAPFDLVFAGRLGNAVWWESIAGNKPRADELRIVDFDDIESLMLNKWLDTIAVSPFWTWKLGREVVWLRRLERRIAKTWDAILLCSKVDAARLRELTGKEAWIVPNGYAFQPVTSEAASLICNLLFVGSFEYFPNAQGVEWFVETIWPQVRAELGDGVELSLVGLNPTPAILALGTRAGITVAGNVPSVDPYYAQSHIVIAPLQAGSGTRIKLIEAAAKRRAIVTTTLGCEGLGFVDGVHAEIADDPADFSARIVRLSRDAQRREQMAGACRKYARAVFSAETVSNQLIERIERLVSP